MRTLARERSRSDFCRVYMFTLKTCTPHTLSSFRIQPRAINQAPEVHASLISVRAVPHPPARIIFPLSPSPKPALRPGRRRP